MRELVREPSQKGYNLLSPLDTALYALFGDAPTVPFRVPVSVTIGDTQFQETVSVADLRAQAIQTLPWSFFEAAIPKTAVRIHSIPTDTLMAALRDKYPDATLVEKAEPVWRTQFKYLKMTPQRYRYARHSRRSSRKTKSRSRFSRRASRCTLLWVNKHLLSIRLV